VTAPSFIDGGWFDIATFLVAVLFASIKCLRGHHRFILRANGFSILNGMAIFPLVLLITSIVWKEAIDNILRSNHLMFAGAGAVALFALLEDEFDRAAA